MPSLQTVWDALKRILGAIKWAGLLIAVYPRWAQMLFVSTAVLTVSSLVVFVFNFSNARRQFSPDGRLLPPVYPYDSFKTDFREVIAPWRVSSGSILHLVWGDLGKVRGTTVVLPVSQSFDLDQRGRQSVLASFETHTINSAPFYDHIDSVWPESQRQSAAGIGNTQFLPISQESQGLVGVIFVVTTRNRSLDAKDYGRYKNTSFDGINLILDSVIREASSRKLSTIALPLLGAGYANINRTNSDPGLKLLLEKSVVLLSVDKLLLTLNDPSSPLRRAILVIYSSDPQGEGEDEIWTSVQRFLNTDLPGRQQAIAALRDQLAQR